MGHPVASVQPLPFAMRFRQGGTTVGQEGGAKRAVFDDPRQRRSLRSTGGFNLWRGMRRVRAQIAHKQSLGRRSDEQVLEGGGGRWGWESLGVQLGTERSSVALSMPVASGTRAPLGS